MATIKTLAAGVSPYKTAAATAPTVLTTTVNGRPSTVAAATSVIVNGQAALNSLITTSQTGVFQGANVTINLDEQNFSTTNQVTSNTNYPSGNTGEIQFNSGSNSFASNAYFTYDNSNVITPGIRTDGYFYSNGSPFIGGGNAAIGNFIFTGDAMTIAHANSTLSVTGNGSGNINVSSNSKTWIFGASGNLTLPANTFAVNYANGNPVVISGAGANLPLANGTSNINIATANGNVTVTANAGNTWIFDTTGNLVFPTGMLIYNESPNTRIAQNSGTLKITANNTASLKMGWTELEGVNAGNVAQIILNGTSAGYPQNVVVWTGNISSTTYQWIFDKNGNLTLPANTFAVNYANGDPVVIGVGGGLPLANGTSNINIATANGNVTVTAGANTWTFDTDGDLIFPTGMIIDDEGANTRIYQNSGNLKVTANNTATLRLGWSEFIGANAGGNVAQIIMNGTSARQPGNVVVRVGNSSSTPYSWIFDNKGDLTAPGNISATNLVINSIRSDDSTFVTIEDGINITSGLISAPESISLTAGANTWNFDTTGNLTLPANSFAVNYANGNPVVISGGATLPIANGTSNINIATANGNVTITANGSPTWTFKSDGNLSLPTAGNIVGAVNIIGNGTGNVNVIANNKAWTFAADGNLVLPLAGNIVNNGNTWNFGYNGTTQFPGNLLHPPAGNPLDIQVTVGNAYATVSLYDVGSQLIIQDNTTGPNPAWALFEADLANVNTPQAVVILKPGDTGDEVRWTFNADGNIVFPTLTTQRGDNPSGTITGQTLLFGDYTQEAIISTPDGNEFGYANSQRLVINPGAGAANSSGEGGDIYLWAGRGGDASGSGGDIKIRGGQGGANTQGGSGGAGGYIRIEAGDAASTGGGPGFIEITGGYSNVQGGNVNIWGGYGNTGQGGTVGIYGGYTAYGSYGNVEIHSGSSGWNFAADGNLTLPNGATISDSSNVASLNAGGNTRFAQLYWNGNIGNGNPYDGSDYYTWAYTSNVGFTIQHKNASTSTDNEWHFGTDGNLTAPGNISTTGNITGAYLFGNGSQLTDVGAASVPGQTILPTIQTITVADTSGVGNAGGAGSAFANVTVANTIPVTEYGVIITSGTSSQKYATGALGSIPGPVQLTFSTGLNSTPFTVYAYVTSNAGTYYSNAATGTSGICLLARTQIALSDGTHKAIEDITYTDKLLSWDFDRGCYAETTAMWIKRSETGSQYNLLTFSDGTTLRTFDQHRIFNKQAGAFTYPMTAATPIGTVTVNEHGQEITLTRKQVIKDTIEYYNVITDYHMNLFSDTVLTSCRFNNIYPITDMKFAKDSRTLRTRAEFENVPDRFFHGLRLAEQTYDLDMIEWYVTRLLSLEISTISELTV